MNTPNEFRAFRIHDDEDGYRAGIETVLLSDLSPGEVTIKVSHSSINYKDALAGTGKGRILRRFPLVGGIDVAGHVVASADPAFHDGDAVLCTGSGLSETRDGGFTEYLRLPSEAVIPLPDGLTLVEAMTLGTAGFTAALGLHRLLENHQTPDMGPLVVTGATGGVGMIAVDLFAKMGFAVHAVTGKTDRHAFLKEIGATECLSREAIGSNGKALVSACFGGAMDTAGGSMIEALLPAIAAYGNVATCGNVAGARLATTVMPFIIRGVSLLGVASAGTPLPLRKAIWNHLANDWKPKHLDRIHTTTVTLDELPGTFDQFLRGKSFGRIVVDMNPS